MAPSGFVTTEANRVLDNSLVASSPVDLVTAMGTAAAAPTKVVGGSYAVQTPTWAAAASAAKSNSAVVTYSGLPAATVVGIDVQNVVPARTWFSPFATSKVVNAGDSIVFAVGGMSFSLTNSP